MLEALTLIARSLGCRRLWLVTADANTEAMAFYWTVGWQQVAIHRGAGREARRLKPEIPEVGPDGTPIEDEIEFEWRLDEA
jgi:hypothetical protein